MRVTIIREYELSCAHQLTAGINENHPCRRLHGHSYKLEFAVTAELDEDGMVFEYKVIDRLLAPILRDVDHHDLNSISERYSNKEATALAENPTIERLCVFLWVATVDMVRHLSQDPKQKPVLSFIRIREDGRSVAEIHG